MSKSRALLENFYCGGVKKKPIVDFLQKPEFTSKSSDVGMGSVISLQQPMNVGSQLSIASSSMLIGPSDTPSDEDEDTYKVYIQNIRKRRELAEVFFCSGFKKRYIDNFLNEPEYSTAPSDVSMTSLPGSQQAMNIGSGTSLGSLALPTNVPPQQPLSIATGHSVSSDPSQTHTSQMGPQTAGT